jgi:putative endonuclease
MPATDDRAGLGRRGENLAAALLESEGYSIIERNWRRPGLGEIDLIAADDDGCLVFVEVRARRGTAFGTPEESITGDKRVRLRLLAELYVQTTAWQYDWRIDVVALELDSRGRILRKNHIINAVTGWDD